ncbi:UDP-3-O-(3-hydroxymyristoyl)glucosamine N-acyltransferase [Synoicihabitans lomoniglobus]|uniref:UDP-3-O-acylglucosamine N-acyltransferase n=1 Tax=Synoicihabitans lomoniglobus TaxID=2909285 RepID=A0AAF0CQ73_9BACT|nr:UDP-3-O-(3-hydroxymyristoyl)glucosamine N-acyltransferase [Opitutaceae bacterium LMO-M01]WED66033.1 UDP-3-O-(3-hydroxymyristoyl)glucosamine N-acyltransferase [Opitutaceae bacterium LMO-M01]
MQISFRLDELVAMVSPVEVRGAYAGTIGRIAALDDAEVGSLSFLGNSKYRSSVATSRASVILVPTDYVGEPGPDQCHLVVAQPSVALALVCARIEHSLWPRPTPGVHPSAVVAPDATISSSATVGPLCVIESGAHVGDRSHLQAQVFVGRNARVGGDCWLAPSSYVATECELGDRVRVHAGTVIGSDGFGYEFVDGQHAKVPQVGTVVVEADVEIGANCTIDRARFNRTVIGQGTKLDNQVQIGHNVVVGRHCILCGMVGVSGSTTIGDYAVIGGQAGLAGHLTVGKGAKIGGQAAVTSDIDPGIFVNGSPALPYQLERRLLVLNRRLPDLFKKVESLAAQIDELKKASDL